jgi:ATP-dependent Lhr-like helicase
MGKVDLNNLKEVLNRIRRKETKIQILVTDKPSPFTYRMLNQFAEVPEMMAPETVQTESLARMRKAIEYHNVQLLCINCGELEEEKQIKDIPDEPHCRCCGSGLLAALHRSNSLARESVLKRLGGQSLNGDEQKALAETRRNADIVLSYGRKGIIAMSVRGIGPQTAARILAKMHMDEAEFYKDLLEAKILYVETRQYWNER